MVDFSPDRITTLLFVPASRIDRLEKASGSGADAIIIDLEDAVAASEKDAARAAFAKARLPDIPVIVRINAVGTSWHLADIEMAAARDVGAIMLPKSENGSMIEDVCTATGKPVVALVETARGISALHEIAEATGIRAIAFGSLDFSADIGCAHEPEALLFARSQIVLASRKAGLAAPIDGVSLSVSDDMLVEEDARRAVRLGFGAKLCVHPRQIEAVMRGFTPSAADIAWAYRVVSAAGGGAIVVDGMMVDRPVWSRAEKILRLAERLQPRDQ
jgi:citrate lyase subunit beta/citryl-CoA lyase